MIGTPLTSVGDTEGLVHAALLYRSSAQLRSAVEGYLEDARAAGEPVLAILPSAQLDVLDDLLGHGPQAVSHRDMTEVGRNPGCLLGELEEWMAAHSGRVRVVSEPIWPGRAAAEITECMRHEALVNHVFADAPVSLLCPYDAASLDADVISGAEMTHPWLLDEAGARPSLAYGDPLALAAGTMWPQAEPSGSVSEIPFDGDLRALRHAVCEDDRVRALPALRRQDLVFAVNEIATNVIRHGDGTCETRLWRDGDRVVAEVRSTTPIGDVMAGRRRPGPEADGGRGLWLVNQLCDLVELRNDRGGAWLRMHVAVA